MTMLLKVTTTLLVVVLVSVNAFGPKAFVPMHQNAVSSGGSLLSPDPLQPAKSVVSPTTGFGGNLYQYGGNNNKNPLLRMAANYNMNHNNGGNNMYNGGGDYYNTYGNNYNRGGGGYGPYQNGYNTGGYRGASYNNFNGMMNDGSYNGEYYGGNQGYYNGPMSVNSMQYNNGRYGGGGNSQFQNSQDMYYNDWSGNHRGGRGAPLRSNRNMYGGGPMSNQNMQGGGLMRYGGGDYYDQGSNSFYNNEGKRVRRYDPYSDSSLYNEDALYMQQQAAQAQRGYETNFNREYNTGGYNYNQGLRRYDPYFDQGMYNEDALYDRTGQGLTQGNRFMLPPAAGGYNGGYGNMQQQQQYYDPYYSPDRFGWGETGGRPNRGRYMGYDNNMEDEYGDGDHFRRGAGYNQRRRPSSSVMGNNIGRGRGRRGDYGSYDDYDDDYEEDRRRQRRRVRDRSDFRSGGRGGGGRGDYYDEDMYDRNPRSSSSSRSGRGGGGRRKDPFTRNIEDDAMENMRSGRGRRGEPTTSRREEREYAMSGGGRGSSRSRRDGGGRGSTVNGSYSRGSTVNGSYYPPPRGEANGGMSIDDLKDML